MKMTKQVSCALWCLTSFKQVRTMRPIIPMTAAMIEQTDKIFCALESLRTKRPRCRSQRSTMNTPVKVTTVVVPAAMKRGCNACAPISEMYLHFHNISRGSIKSIGFGNLRNVLTLGHGHEVLGVLLHGPP